MAKPHPEKCIPQLVEVAMRRAKDRQSAFSEYVVAHYRATGNLAPGCDAKDFFAAYDQFASTMKEVQLEEEKPDVTKNGE